MTDVQGRCPACGGASLFLGDGGHVTCSRSDCPAPDAADDMLGEGALMLHRVAALASDLFTAGAPGPQRDVARRFLEALQRKEPRRLDCGLCYGEQGEEVHPHPECPQGQRGWPFSVADALGGLKLIFTRWKNAGHEPTIDELLSLVATMSAVCIERATVKEVGDA